MTRHVTAETRKKIEAWEGIVLHAYDDATGQQIMPGQKVRGTLTIGIGHTGPDVKPGMTISTAEADTLLERDLASAETTVENAVKVPLTDRQFGTLVSFAFNAGNGAFLTSTLLKKLNAGQYDAVPTELAKWTKTTINGKKVASPGLVTRRANEAAYWSSGTVSTSAANVTAQQGAIPEKEAPKWLTPEAVATGATAVSAAGTVAAGNGPVQYALAAILVIAVLAGIYIFVIKRLRPV